MPAWPGNMSGKEVAYNMISMAAKANKGFDAETGYDWAQLISKYTMGAMAYNQAVDNTSMKNSVVRKSLIINPTKMAFITPGKSILGMKHSDIGELLLISTGSIQIKFTKSQK